MKFGTVIKKLWPKNCQ